MFPPPPFIVYSYICLKCGWDEKKCAGWKCNARLNTRKTVNNLVMSPIQTQTHTNIYRNGMFPWLESPIFHHNFFLSFLCFLFSFILRERTMPIINTNPQMTTTTAAAAATKKANIFLEMKKEREISRARVENVKFICKRHDDSTTTWHS